MKHKYLITRNDKKSELVIQELGELDKDMYSLLCEELYDTKNIQAAITKGKKTLISAIRTENLFPIGIYAERIAEAVINMFASKNDQSVELVFNDVDLVARTQQPPLIIEETNDETDDIDDLLEDDMDDSEFDEKDDIEKISYPLKITDDDPGDIDDEND